jgi:hypothetical protein
LRPSFASRPWRLGLVACLLLFAQVLLVTHAPHELLTDDGRVSCVVCVLGHDLGGAMCPVQSALSGPMPRLRALTVELPSVLVFAVAAYQARGPPSRG